MSVGRHVEPVGVDGALAGDEADRRLDGVALAADPLEDPLEDPAVVAVSGPQPAAVLALAEPVDVEDLGELVRIGVAPMSSQWAK